MLPKFLLDVQLTKANKELLAKNMATWLETHALIKSLPVNEKSVQFLRCMMVYELTGKKRLHIVDRLRMKFNSMRAKVEAAQLYG